MSRELPNAGGRPRATMRAAEFEDALAHASGRLFRRHPKAVPFVGTMHAIEVFP
jgi:hypothetical protein